MVEATTTLPGEQQDISAIPTVVEEDRYPDPIPETPTYFDTDIGKTPFEELDINQRMERLDNLSGSPPSPAADPGAIEEQMRRMDELSSEITPYKGLQIINAGIADILDFPAEMYAPIVNYALTGTGLDKITGTLHTKQFRRFFNAVGYSLPEGQIPDNWLAWMLRFMGQGMVPLLGLAGKVKPGVADPAGRWLAGKEIQWPTTMFGKQTLPKGMEPLTIAPLESFSLKEAAKTAAHTMVQTAARKPIRFIGAEQAASAGAGTLFGLAREKWPDSPTAQLTGGLIGGLTPATVIGTLKLLGPKALKVVYDAGRSLTPLDAENRAATRLGQLVQGRDKAVENLMGTPENKWKRMLDEAEGTTDEAERIRRSYEGRTEAQDIDIAHKEALGLGPEVKDVTSRMLPEVLEKMTPTQRIGADRGLLPLEKTILDNDPLLRRQGDLQHAELNDLIIRAMSTATEGDVALTKQEFAQQKKYLQLLIESRLDVARIKADEAIAKGGAKLDRQATSNIVREELDKAVQDMDDTVKVLWAKTNLTPEVSTEPLLTVWKRILTDRNRLSDPGDIRFSGRGSMDLIRELGHIGPDGRWIAGTMGEKETLKILQTFRSRILTELRGERARKNTSNKKRVFSELQEAILAIFKAEEFTLTMKKNADGVFEAQQPDPGLLRAIAASRLMNDKFNKSEMGKILGANPDGSFQVEPALTLQRLIGGANAEKRAVHLKELFKAIERETADTKRLTKDIGDAEIDPLNVGIVTEAVKSYIKHTFFKNFVFDDEITMKSAQQWIKDNRDTLKQIPGLKQELEEAMKTGNTRALWETRSERARKLFLNPKNAIAIQFIEENPLDIYNRTGQFGNMTLNKFMSRIDKIVFKAAKDDSGQATEGLQQSIFNWIRDRSMLKGGEGSKAISATDQSYLSGFEMTRVIDNPVNNMMIRKILTEEQMARLEMIRVTAKELDSIRSAVGLPNQRIMLDTPGWILHSIGRVGGAGLGRWFQKKFMGGGTIQTPGVFSHRLGLIMKNLTDDYAERLLTDAVTSENPLLLKAILMKIDTPQAQQFVNMQLNAYIAQLLVQYNIGFPKEDFYGNMEDEEDEPVDAKLRLMKEMEQPQ